MTTTTTRRSPVTTEHARTEHPLRVWPVRWAELGALLVAFFAMTAVWVAVGLVIVNAVEPSEIGEAETSVSEWFENQRTDTGNTVAVMGSFPSDTVNKVVIMAVLFVVFPLLFRRWHEWAFLATVLLLEVSVYGLVSYLVGRARPPVERLTTAPTESWPSGHVAAAVAFYVGLLIVARWRTTDRRILAPLWVVAVVVPVGMVLSRLYLGMHYVSDTVGGIVLGLVCLAVTHRIFERSVQRLVGERGDSLPWSVTRLDLTERRADDLHRSHDRHDSRSWPLSIP